MAYLIFILVALVLFGGFLALTVYESRRGRRVAPQTRASLDAAIDEVSFALSHTDFRIFVRNLAREVAARVAHDVAHASLIVVRFLERMLTKAVRALRTERVNLMHAEQARQASDFVSQMRDFKDELRNARSEEPEQ